MPQVISANRLTDGIVVFFAHGAWVERLADAQVYADASAASAGLDIAERDFKANLVVEIAAFEVQITSRGLEAAHLRDRVRAAGPTVRLDHGKQAV